MDPISSQYVPVSPPAHDKSRRWKIILSLLAIFAAGLAVGSVITLQVLRHAFQHRLDASRWTTLMLNKIDHKVHLTPAQRRALEPVIRSGIGDAQGVRDRAFAEIAGIVRRSRSKASATLSVEQQTKLDDFIAERAQLLHRWLGPSVLPISPPEAGLP